MTKRFNPKNWRPNTWSLWVSFLLPALFMTAYFASRHMAPFGNSSILTVDLGQQYIDFFEFFRHTLLTDPSQIFYSFSKGLGGEMYGDWAYYLMSPTNLLLLPFANTQLPSALLWLTVLKYGLTSWSFAFAILKMRWQKGWSLPIFGTAYAFSGWFVANQLNLLWLDVAILLPLVVLGLESYFKQKSMWYYVLPLTAACVINYYMAYMLGLFMVLYLVWRLTWSAYPWQQRLHYLGQFIFASIISIGLAAVIWLPTAVSLLNSKGQHMLQDLKWQFDYPAADILGKFFVGSFNFAQMPTGLPNIFVGTLPLIIVWFFITSRQIRWPVRLTTCLVTAVLVLSMMYSPLNLLWHGFQYPVWYPYRFSFVFCFWLLWLTVSIWTNQFRLSSLQLLSFLGLAGLGFGYLYQRVDKLNFLSQEQLLIGGCFLALFIILLLSQSRGRWWSLLLAALVLSELATSTVLTLNNFSYLTNREYQTAMTNLNKLSEQLPHHKNDFYRVAQSFQRTKGDPFQGHYYGASVFSSGLEHQQSDFMAAIGQPEGDNYISYDSGTILTDTFLGMRYLLQSNDHEANRPGTPANLTTLRRQDTNDDYPIVYTNTLTLLSKNPQALPLAFAANSDLTNLKWKENDPLGNQNRLWAALTGNDESPVFTSVNFDHSTTVNTQLPQTVTGAYLTKQDQHADAKISLSYIPSTDDPYYLTLGDSLNSDDLEIQINGQTVPKIPSHRHTIVIPLRNGQKGQTQTITMHFKRTDLWLKNVSLYRANQQQLTREAKAIKQHALVINHFSNTDIKGTITMPAGNQMLMTTIPYGPGWQATVDGQPVKPLKIGKFLIGLPLNEGQHQVQFTYRPPFFKLGLSISLGTILFTLGLAWSSYLNHRHDRPDLP